MPRKKVTNAGGKREGAGRKSYFGEKTVLAQYSVPVSKFDIFDSAATEMLEQWKIKDVEGIKAKVDRAIEAGEAVNISPIDRESAIKLIEDTLNDMPFIQDRGVFTEELPVFNDDKVFPPSDEEIKQQAREKNAETKEAQPEIIVYDNENEKGVEVVFPVEKGIVVYDTEKDIEDLLENGIKKGVLYVSKEEQANIIEANKQLVEFNHKMLYGEQEPEKDHSGPRYSETQIESLIDTANAKYKTGKIIKEVGTNEEYRLGYNLGFNKEINSVVMGGTSIESGLYKSEVVLFSNDEWAKF